MRLPPAKPAYDQRDEQATRTALEQADLQYLKANVSVQFIYLTSSTGAVGKLTIVGTTPTWTAI